MSKVADLYEPPLTSDVADDVLESQVTNMATLNLPFLPCHSQGIERHVQMWTHVCKNHRTRDRQKQEMMLKLKSNATKAPRRKKDLAQFDSDSDIEIEE